jgi:hypothetical protein
MVYFWGDLSESKRTHHLCIGRGDRKWQENEKERKGTVDRFDRVGVCGSRHHGAGYEMVCLDLPRLALSHTYAEGEPPLA